MRGPYYAPSPLRGACFAKASQPEGAEDVSKGADAGGKEQKKRTRELLLWGSKLAKNAASEVFVNFVMARDGLAEPGQGLLVPVVLASVSYKKGAFLLNFLN